MHVTIVTVDGAMTILRRLGAPASAPLCSGGHNCPELLELDSGDFAVIGTDITEEAARSLPAGSGCGPQERMVQIPRALLVRARSEIPTCV
jgi:hypothetical protein